MELRVYSLVVFLLMLFSVSNADEKPFLFPSLSGEIGVLRAVSAQNNVRGAMSAIGSGQFFRTTDLLNTSQDLKVTNTNWAGDLGISYAAIDFLEVFLTESNTYHDFNNGSETAYALGDLTFGLKLGLPLASFLALGADASVRFLSKVGAWGYNSSATSGGGKAIATIAPDGIPLRAHLNIGYWKDNSSVFSRDIVSPIYQYAAKIGSDRILGVLGLDLPLHNGVLIPLLEYSTELASGTDFSRSPNRITPGIRVVPFPPVAVTLGLDLSLTKSDVTPTGKKVRLQPPWNAILAVSYTYVPERPPLEAETPAPELVPPPAVPVPPPSAEKKGAILMLEKGKIELAEPILFFEYDQTRIMPESYWLLDSVAEILKSIPELKIRIEGHTDNIGGERYNMLLSQARTDSVRNYLLTKGIFIDRMEAVGYGPSRPIADNSTLEGRAKNRRVEFTIITQEPNPSP